MIGIVVVSHSRALARAALGLAGEMVQGGSVRIEIAAGLDETTFGTDAVAVAEAVAAADSGDGVLVLMDLGSAVLSAELALELLESPHVVELCGAAIVEGLVAAAVCAASGAPLAEVAAEAGNALSAKRAQLGERVDDATGTVTSANRSAGRGEDAVENTAPQGNPGTEVWRVDKAVPSSGVAVPGADDVGSRVDSAAAEGNSSRSVGDGMASDVVRAGGAAGIRDSMASGDSGDIAPVAAADDTSVGGEYGVAEGDWVDEAGDPVGGERAGGAAAGSAGEVVASFLVTPVHGLHARPVARLIAEVRGCAAVVSLRNLTTGAGPASGRSPSRIAALGALAGHSVEIVARGPQAREVVDRVIDLAARGFGEAVEAASNAAAVGGAPVQERMVEGGAPVGEVSGEDGVAVGGASGEDGVAVGGASDEDGVAVSEGVGEDGAPDGGASGEGGVVAGVGDGGREGEARRSGAGDSSDFVSAGSDAEPGYGGIGEVRVTGPFSASAGIAVGPVWHLVAREFDVTGHSAGLPDEEIRRLDSALARVRADIRVAVGRARAAGLSAEAEILQAHLVLLEDDELLREVRSRIDEGESAEGAWAAVWDGAAGELARLADEYQRARAADIEAVRDQVLAALLGREGRTVGCPGILVAVDLTPGEVAGLDRDIVTGIVLAQGSPTAHSAILARAKGIPAIVGAGDGVLSVPEGTTVAFDGGSGRLVIDPDAGVIDEFASRAGEQSARYRAAVEAASGPASTRDGVTVSVAANVGSVVEAADAVRGGADLAGLVRTEFLFLDRDHAPTVDEQERVYRDIAQAFAGRRVVLRTLDAGGDKPLPYIPKRSETNPFLGLRGIRLTLAYPELLRDQLRAIVRVAADHPVSIMLPMVTALDEVRAARALLETAAETESAALHNLSIELGIMVEIPATAARTELFAPHVDFLSIGTNDLTQYALAAERGNDALTALADPLDPGVLRLVDQACRGAGDTRIAVCGEVAADPAAIPVLLGLGVTELSVAPPALAPTKATIRNLTLDHCTAFARRALTAESAAAVRAGRSR